MIAFLKESERLVFTPVKREDLAQLMGVYNSNPFYNLVSTGKSDVTLEEIEEDWKYNEEYDDSYSILITDKSNGEVIGHSQFLIRNPRDNNPWLGLIMVEQKQQGKGYAREFITSLMDWLEHQGFESLHLAVLEKNDKVLPFYYKLGFAAYETRQTERYGPALCLKRIF